MTAQAGSRRQGPVAGPGAETLLAAIVGSTSDAIIGKTLDGVVTSWNAAAERIFGYSAAEMLGQPIERIIPPARREEERAILARAAGGELTREYETERLAKRGKVVSVAITVSPIRSDGDPVIGVSTIARDITERKASEARLAALVDSMSDAIVGKTLDSVVTSWNAAAERLFGYRAEEIIGQSIDRVLPRDRRDEERAIIARAARGEMTRDFETERLTKRGERIIVALTVSPIAGSDGSVVGVSTIARDVTERKKAEEKMRTASAYARSLIEASLDPLVTISPDGKITDVNRATELATGLPRELLVGTDFLQYFTEPEKAREGYQLVFGQGSVKDYPLAIRDASGHVTDVLYNAAVYRDGAGKVAGVFAAARDVTERKKAEALQQAASAYARSLIEASLDPLVTISPDGKITDVNRATEQATGAPRERLIGSDFSDYFTDPEKARSGYKQVFEKGKVTDYPLAIRHAGGGTIDVLYNAALYRDPTGKVLGVFAAARDVGDQRRLQSEIEERNVGLEEQNRRVEEANRLKSEFLANMSHELRTPLNSIIGFSEFLDAGRAGPLNDRQRKFVGDVLGSGRHLLQLINDLLDLSRVEAGKTEIVPGKFDPAVVLGEVVTGLRPLAERKSIVVELECEPGRHLVVLDATRWKQIAFNLLSNAIKFTEPGGRVRIQGERRGGACVLTVTDTGIGISERDQKRLFRSFEQLDSTLRRRYEGSGLGLALTKKLVDLQGGTITVESEPGRGSTFRVRIPTAANGRKKA